MAWATKTLQIALFFLAIAGGAFDAALCGLREGGFSVQSASAADNAKSKFNIGDAIEVNQGDEWVEGKVVGITPTGRYRVATEKFPAGLPVKPDLVRAPGKNTAAADKNNQPGKSPVEDESNPFATPEEKGQSVGKRSWSDRTGKFKIVATILRFEGDKVVLKRDDGKEVSVPIERLCDADQAIIAKAGGPAVGGGEKPTEPAGGSPKSAAQDDIKLVTADLASARPLDISQTTAWTYQPDVSAKESSPKDARVALGQKLEGWERPEGLLVSPAKQTAFVIYKASPFPPKDQPKPGPRVVACDLAKRKVAASGQFHSEQLPLAVNDDGQRLLAREAAHPFGKGTRMFLYEMDGFKAAPKLAWIPYPEGDKAKEIVWGDFVDNTHALTLSDAGLLVLWDLSKGVKAIYTAKSEMKSGAAAAFSPNKKYLTVAERDGVALLEPLTGKVAGYLPMTEMGFQPALALRDDGRRLAVASGGRIRVWDLDRRELTRDFLATGANSDKGMGWADDERLITARGDLIDVERRIRLWKYSGVSDASQFAAGALWTVDDAAGRQTLVTARLPHEAARSRAASLKPSDIIVIQPGMEVSLDLQFVGTPQDQQTVQQALTKRLTDNGMKVVPQSPVKLTAQIKPGRAIAIGYHMFGSRNETRHNAMTQVMELSYVINGQPVWTHKGESHPPHRLRLQQGQTIDQALADHMRLDPKGLGGIFVPSHIANAPGPESAWTSPLPGAS